MRPVTHSNGHDNPRLLYELVPSITAVVDEVVIAGKDAIGEPVIPHELPDVFLRIQLGTFGWQRDDADVVGNNQPRREVPPGLIEQQHRMAAGRDLRGDRGEMKVHRFCIAPRQDEAGGFALFRAYSAEYQDSLIRTHAPSRAVRST